MHSEWKSLFHSHSLTLSVSPYFFCMSLSHSPSLLSSLCWICSTRLQLHIFHASKQPRHLHTLFLLSSLSGTYISQVNWFQQTFVSHLEWVSCMSSESVFLLFLMAFFLTPTYWPITEIVPIVLGSAFVSNFSLRVQVTGRSNLL